MSIHDGHRQRLKERYCKEGLEHFHELQVLELLLFYCVKRGDTNPIAHALLERFKTLSGVLEADMHELMQVPGVGEHTAIFLRLMRDMSRYYAVESVKDMKILSTIDECGAYLAPYFMKLQKETVFLLCLDAKCKLIVCEKIGEGSINSVNISIRKIVERALSCNATSVVLAHNHPSGLALPSGEDVLTTKRLGRALYAVDVTLVDHLVFADGDYVSLAQSGRYSIKDTQDAF